MKKMIVGIVGIGLLTGALQAREGFEYRSQMCQKTWADVAGICMVIKGLCKDVIVGNRQKIEYYCKDTNSYIWNEYKKAYRKYK